MKKQIGLLIVLALVFGFGVGKGQANEGNISLGNGSIGCEGISLWRESAYRISAGCQGLVYPYETQYEHYVAWAKLENGNVTRIGEVERGYFEGNVQEPFGEVVVTAEKEGLPRRASEKEVLSGQVRAFAVEKTEKAIELQATPIPLKTNSGTMTVQAERTASTGVTVGNVIGKILKSLLVVIGVIILVAIGASLVFRRRGSVSST